MKPRCLNVHTFVPQETDNWIISFHYWTENVCLLFPWESIRKYGVVFFGWIEKAQKSEEGRTNYIHIENSHESFCPLIHLRRIHSYRPPSKGVSFSTSKLYLQTRKAWNPDQTRRLRRQRIRSLTSFHSLVCEPRPFPLLRRGEEGVHLLRRRHPRRLGRRRISKSRVSGRTSRLPWSAKE